MTEAAQPEAQPSVESKPAEVTENSAASTVTRPLARDVYDWASRLASEVGGEVEDCYFHPENYYWTAQMERLVTKLRLTKRALIGVVGVQGVGKTATMRAIQAQLVSRGFHRDQVIAVKMPESGGLNDALKIVFSPPGAHHSRFGDLLGDVMSERLYQDRILKQRVFSRARHAGDTGLAEEVEKTNVTFNEATFSETDVLELRNLIPQRIIRELETETLERLLESQRVIMIDMPDYPRHDRRLIARDLDDIAGLWNRLMMSPRAKETSLIVFVQKETFSAADHFFYGKCDIIPLMPLTVTQLLEAYNRKWSGYAPFNEDALQYIAKMSRGVFRRFKRYIGLALETQIVERAQADISSSLIDLEAVKKSVTNEEVMRDMDKEFDGIFRKREQKEKALEIIKKLSEPHIRAEHAKAAGAKSLKEFLASDADPMPDGIIQAQLAWDLGLSEMAVSRLVRELEQHGYIKRTAWQQWNYVDMNW